MPTQLWLEPCYVQHGGNVMQPVVGIYPSRGQAQRAANDIRQLGLGERVELLLPGAQEMEEALQTDEAEQPGVGQALGGVVGATAGASAGFGIGAVTASLLIPGVGAVTAIGIAAAALLGAIGAAGGVAAGNALEEKSRTGLPRDEAYLYEEALLRGKGVLFAHVESEEEDKAVRKLLEASGAESLDVAREKWWVGLRGAHGEADVTGSVETGEKTHGAYRRGFQVALEPDMDGEPYTKVKSALERRMGTVALSEAFRRGYERGVAVAAERGSTLASTENK